MCMSSSHALLPASAEALTARLKQAGLKVTLPRLLTIHVLKQHQEAMDVHQIFHALLKEHREITLGSLYAVLKQLTSSGVIGNYVASNRKKMYSYEVFPNLVACECPRCGNSVPLELDSQAIKTLLAPALSAHNAHFQSAQIHVLATCQRCLGNSAT